MPLFKRLKVADPHSTSTENDLPRLMTYQAVNNREPKQTLGETSTSATSTVSEDSATSSDVQEINPSTSRTLMVTLKVPAQCQISNTILKVHLLGGEGHERFSLRDYMQASQFFAKIIGSWSLPPAKVDRLHITFPWLPKGNDDRLCKLSPQDFNNDCFDSICKEIGRAPCWTVRDGECCVDVLIVPIPKKDDPTTRDGGVVP